MGAESVLLSGDPAADRRMPARSPRGGVAGRRRILVLVVVFAAGVTLGGVVAARFIKSPSQVAAETRPPAPTVLTATVQRRVLTNAVVLRGVVTTGRQTQVNPTGQVSGQPLVLTKVFVRKGGSIRAGQVLLELSGRPLFVLPGRVPAYRDITPGSQGDDVAQLQSGLRALGFSTGADTRGHFGSGTKTAVGRFYRHLGYSTPNTDQPGATGELQQAQDVVTTAKRALNDLLNGVTAGPSGSTDASGSPTTGQAASDRSRQLQIRYARQDLKTARARYAAVAARHGPEVPLNEIAFLSKLPAWVVSIGASVGGAPHDPLLKVTTGALSVSGKLNPSDAGLVRVGAKVTVDDDVTGYHGTGTVTSIGAITSGSNPVRPVAVKPSRPMPSALLGQNVRLSIVAASTSGPVLAVPEAAITVSAGGGAGVIVQEADGSQRRVPVTTGISGSGLVEVRPNGRLQAGDKVVIG